MTDSSRSDRRATAAERPRAPAIRAWRLAAPGFVARTRGLFAWHVPQIRDRWRQVIALSQLAGAAIGGVEYLVKALEASRDTSPLPAWHSVLVALFCCASVAAGWLLLRRRPGGRSLSVAVQSLQGLWIWLPGASFRLTSGLALLASWTTERGLDGIAGATVAFRLGLPEPGAGVGLGVNAFAIVAVSFLLRMGDGAGGTAAGDRPPTHPLVHSPSP